MLDRAAALALAGLIHELLAELVRAGVPVAHLLPPAGPVPDVPANLSGIEADIVEALGSEHLTARQIAERAGYRLNSHLRSVLSRMRREGLIHHDDAGYFRPS